jgi:hypothetical protein
MKQKKSNFLLLVAQNKENAGILNALYSKIKRDIDSTASASWIDSQGAGIFISTHLPPQEIWRLSIPDLKTTEERQSLSQVLVLELGYRHWSPGNTKGLGWLNGHATAEPSRE